jgi:hypothetical protein
MSVYAVRAVSPAATGISSDVTPASTGQQLSLLPEPALGALAGSDPLSVMYLFESKGQKADVSEGTHRIRALQGERAQALQKELAAIQQEDEALKQKSFWDDLGSVCGEIAKVAGVVASVAAAVATCGAAAPLAAVAIAGAVLSTAAFADGELHVLRSLGVDDKTAGFIDMGMSLGGALCSAGAGLAASEQTASSTVSIVSRTATVVTGVTAVGSATSTIEAGREQANVDRADADQILASALSDHLLRTIQQVIDDVQDSDDKSKQIMKTIASTKGIENETATIAAGSIKG